MATFRSTDSSPKEQFINHQAGLDGSGGASYIDTVICREKDANTAWTSASDGVLEERRYYCQNWRADVSAVLTSGGLMVEWVKYSSYGSPFGLPGGDTNSDGDCDAADVTQVGTWIAAPAYDVRGDVNLSGTLTSADTTILTNNYQGTTLGWNNLSAVGNRKGYAGYEWESQTGGYHVRHRYLRPDLGRWIRRDPAEYIDGNNFYAYIGRTPLNHNDYMGLRNTKCQDRVDLLMSTEPFQYRMRQIHQECGDEPGNEPKVSCCTDGMCVEQDTMGWYKRPSERPPQGEVCICENPDGTPRGHPNTDDWLKHELTHAWQYCNFTKHRDNPNIPPSLDWSDPVVQMCMEMGAFCSMNDEALKFPQDCGELCDRYKNFGMTHRKCFDQCFKHSVKCCNWRLY